MRIVAFLLLLMGCLIGGCGSDSAAPQPPRTTSATIGKPYRLYTHCGIEWAKIQGTFWRAAQPLSDRNGNPPRGWGNPFQDGTLIVRHGGIAEFSSPAGTVTFQRTRRKQVPAICS